MDQYTKKTDHSKNSFLITKSVLDTNSTRNRSKNDDLKGLSKNDDLKELSSMSKVTSPVPKG